MYEVETLNLLSENDKGSTYTVTERSTSEYLLVYRKSGAEFGNHWHEGNSPSKNPEVLLFVGGSMTMWISEPDGGNEECVELNAPLKLKVFPGYLHRFKATSDCSFLEFNSLDEHIADTFYPEKQA